MRVVGARRAGKAGGWHAFGNATHFCVCESRREQWCLNTRCGMRPLRPSVLYWVISSGKFVGGGACSR